MDQKIQSGKLRKKKNREGRKKYKDVKFENLPFCLSCFFCIEIRLFKPFSLFIFSIRERGRARSGRQSLHGQWDAINMTEFDVERLGFFKSKACLDKMATYTTLSSIEKHLREYIRYLHPHNPIPPPPITNAETTETAIGTTNKRFFCTHPVNREMSLFFFFPDDLFLLLHLILSCPSCPSLTSFSLLHALASVADVILFLLLM